MKRCQRCKKEMTTHTMSYFNTQEICMECKKVERDHPDYEKALDAEISALRSGNYNFTGIGLPADLVEKYKDATEPPPYISPSTIGY